MVEVSQDDFEMLQAIKDKKAKQAVRGKIYRARRNYADKTIKDNHEEEWQAAFDSFNPEG